jgi:hypothetical protein
MQDEDDDSDPQDAKNRAQPSVAKHQEQPVIIDCDEEAAVSPSNSKKPAKPHSINTATTTSSKTPSTLMKTPDRSTMISELAADPAFASNPLMAEAFKKLALHLKGKTGLTTETYVLSGRISHCSPRMAKAVVGCGKWGEYT